LGAEQEHWLSSEFSKPASRENSWNVLGQQTLFGQRHIRTGTGRVLWNDGWDGYPAARTRLTASLLGLAVSNPVILGGDVHENWVGHVLANYDDPGSQRVGIEFCGTSITSRSGRSIKTAERLADNPHFVFAETQRRGYGVVELTPEKMTTALRVLDDVTLKETRIETLANFEVQHGTSFIERV
jgi:alkaline phosphatase D